MLPFLQFTYPIACLSLLTESELSIISLFSDSNHGQFALMRLKAPKVSHLLLGLWVVLDFSTLLPYIGICLQLILCFGSNVRHGNDKLIACLHW